MLKKWGKKDKNDKEQKAKGETRGESNLNKTRSKQGVLEKKVSD